MIFPYILQYPGCKRLVLISYKVIQYKNTEEKQKNGIDVLEGSGVVWTDTGCS